MNKKLLMITVAILILAITATTVLAVGALNSEKNQNNVTENESSEKNEDISNVHPDYTYLRGTKYKNLYTTKYTNLVKTAEVKEPESSSGGYSQIGIGSAANPGYSGSIGKYSLSSKTVAAHLTVQGTSIQNRPVWQCDGNTNYYTNGSVTWAAGSAHLRSGELSQNTVIYGHNWNNCFAPFKRTGSEFESLMAYTYSDFVSQNQYIYLTTNSGVHTFKVFAVCFTKDLSFYINCNGVNVASIAARAKSMSLFDFGVSVSSSDKIITLSTCTRYYSGLGANQRFIVMGKLVSSE